LKKIKKDRVASEKVVGEGSTPTHAPFPDQVPPPPYSEKRKRKDKKDKSKEDKMAKDKKTSSSQPSPKRSLPSPQRPTRIWLKSIRV